MACGHSLALMVILLGFDDDRAKRTAPFSHATGAVPSRCGELPGVRASAAAAVRCRGKASGRRMVRRFPRGRVAPAFCYVRQLCT